MHLAAGRPRGSLTQVPVSVDVMSQLLPVGVALGPPSSQSGNWSCGLFDWRTRRTWLIRFVFVIFDIHQPRMGWRPDVLSVLLRGRPIRLWGLREVAGIALSPSSPPCAMQQIRHADCGIGGRGRACCAVLFCGALWPYLPSQTEMIHSLHTGSLSDLPNVCLNEVTLSKEFHFSSRSVSSLSIGY